MQKVNRILEVGYLIIAIIFFINAITTYQTNTTKAALFGGFAVMAIFMFFFKRRMRKRWFSDNK